MSCKNPQLLITAQLKIKLIAETRKCSSQEIRGMVKMDFFTTALNCTAII